MLIQDTSWDGYTEVPQWIVDGYATLLHETDEQLAEQGLPVVLSQPAQAVIYTYERLG